MTTVENTCQSSGRGGGWKLKTKYYYICCRVQETKARRKICNSNISTQVHCTLRQWLICWIANPVAGRVPSLVRSLGLGMLVITRKYLFHQGIQPHNARGLHLHLTTLILAAMPKGIPATIWVLILAELSSVECMKQDLQEGLIITDAVMWLIVASRLPIR